MEDEDYDFEPDNAIVNDVGQAFDVSKRSPKNINSLLSTNFKFTLNRIPNVSFWCTSANIPSVSIGEVAVPTMFASHHVPGSSISQDPLRLTFAVDEDFGNWKEIYSWMRSVVPFEDFSEILRNHKKYYSDGVLHCLNSAKNPNKRFIFKNMFPISLDGFDLNVALNEPDPVTTSVTFIYETFDIEDVT